MVSTILPCTLPDSSPVSDRSDSANRSERRSVNTAGSSNFSCERAGFFARKAGSYNSSTDRAMFIAGTVPFDWT